MSSVVCPRTSTEVDGLARVVECVELSVDELHVVCLLLGSAALSVAEPDHERGVLGLEGIGVDAVLEGGCDLRTVALGLGDLPVLERDDPVVEVGPVVVVPYECVYVLPALVGLEGDGIVLPFPLRRSECPRLLEHARLVARGPVHGTHGGDPVEVHAVLDINIRSDVRGPVVRLALLPGVATHGCCGVEPGEQEVGCSLWQFCLVDGELVVDILHGNPLPLVLSFPCPHGEVSSVVCPRTSTEVDGLAFGETAGGECQHHRQQSK